MLEESGNDCALFDVNCIFDSVLNEKYAMLRPDALDSGDADKIIRLAEKRCTGYPLQYLLGEWEFYGYRFKVGQGVLIPRPDTETLVERVMEICLENGIKAPRIVDLCSGSGCIAITLKLRLPQSEVYAVELSDIAHSYLKENAALNKADIHIIHGDVLNEASARSFNDIDVIVSNPPYLTEDEMNSLQTEVAHEPSMALSGGNDGLDFYRKITDIWKKSLKSGGFLAYEFGRNQHGDVSRILRENGFENIKLSRDTAGIIRTAEAQIFYGG